MTPARTELYRHLDASGRLLYVGISLSTAIRLMAHRHSSPWFDQIANITIERFDSREAALHAETMAIITEKPIYNLDQTPTSKRASHVIYVNEAAKLLGITRREFRDQNYLGLRLLPPTQTVQVRFSRTDFNDLLAARVSQ